VIQVEGGDHGADGAGEVVGVVVRVRRLLGIDGRNRRSSWDEVVLLDRTLVSRGLGLLMRLVRLVIGFLEGTVLRPLG